MELSNGPKSSEVFQAHTLILNHTLSFIGTLTLKCAVELGIADIMHSHGRPVSISELARSIPIPSEKDLMLSRLMRILVARGVFSSHGHHGGEGEHEAAYSLTPFSRLLVKKGANMSAWVLLPLDQALAQPLFFISDWFKTEGKTTPFELINDGKSLWEVTNERPELNQLFNGAMGSTTLYVMKAAVTEFPDVFRGLRSLVDVGGGTGTAIFTIAEAFPDLKCTIFDLPHVVPTIPETPTLSVVGGDMFEYIPPAKATLLKSILHDWGDEECVKILMRCKEAIPTREEGGKVIIVDIVVNSRPENPAVTETQLLYDVFMMVLQGGKEREEHEWRKIFNDAGFNDYKIFPLLGVHSVIELYP